MMSRGLWGVACVSVAVVLNAASVRAGEILNLYMAKANLLVVHVVETPIFVSALLSSLTAPASYTITSSDDPNYASARSPSSVKQKRKQLYYDAPSQTTYRQAAELWFTLQMPSALQSGKTYTVTFGSSISYVTGTSSTFTFDEKQLYSEAVHVNNIGYLSDASMKYGYVSHYLGEAGSITYSNSTPFQLVNASTNQTVFSGTLSERTSGTGDYKTRIWQCDFSSFSTPGTYKLVVQGIGCSYPFEIGPDGYRRAYQAACRGMFHQRCAMEFTSEHTLWVKPRCHHSDDIPAYQTTSGFVNDNPEALKQKATSERIDCWGGWHDAGDFDHYASHFKIPFMLYAAYELNPSGTGDGEMNIPESGNGVPDIIDEARWGVDLWKRMQKSDGKVPEYTTPYPSASSLDNATAIYASLPTNDVSLLYAGMAAAMGYFLNKFGKSAQATEYINSAKKSYGVSGSGSARAMAALWLWRATGESSYHDTFKNNKPSYPATWGEFNALETYTIANYVLAPNADASIVNSYKTAIVNRAESYISDINGDAMRVSKKGDWMGGWTLPSTMALPLAYKLTGDKKYRDYHALECDYYLGGNPLNMTWMTGVGEKHPTDLLHVEAEHRFGPELGLPTPLGIVPYGPAAYYHSDAEWCKMTANAHNTCFPGASNWSIAELWFEWPQIICNNEYTVHQMQGPAIFAYAALCDDQMSSPWPGPTAAGGHAPRRIELPARQPVTFTRSAGMVHVKATTPVSVELLDFSGRRLVRKGASSSHAIDLSSFARGSYVVSVNGAHVNRATVIGVER